MILPLLVLPETRAVNLPGPRPWTRPGNTIGGSLTVPLTSCFGLVCFANKSKNCQLACICFQTSQAGGQQYNDTSPFSIPWTRL
jgi:hypothetical protein